MINVDISINRCNHCKDHREVKGTFHPRHGVILGDGGHFRFFFATILRFGYTTGGYPLKTLTMISPGFHRPDIEAIRAQESADQCPRVTLFEDRLNSRMLDEQFMKKLAPI